MTTITEFFAGLPFLANAGIFLCGAALLYLVVARTMKKRSDDQA